MIAIRERAEADTRRRRRDTALLAGRVTVKLETEKLSAQVGEEPKDMTSNSVRVATWVVLRRRFSSS
jgi:hypothetical protein